MKTTFSLLTILTHIPALIVSNSSENVFLCLKFKMSL